MLLRIASPREQAAPAWQRPRHVAAVSRPPPARLRRITPAAASRAAQHGSAAAERWLEWWAAADNREAVAVLATMPWAQLDVRDARGRTALHRAALRGDAATLEALLSAGLDADAAEQGGTTSLSLLLQRPAPCGRCVAALLAAGADADARAGAGATPALAFAARRGAADALRSLLDAGADVDARDAAGRTPLFWAAAEGQLACVEALLAAGASVHAANGAGFTPLHAAVRRGGAARVAVVSRLLAAGADPGAHGAMLSGSPLEAAQAQQDDAVTELLRAALVACG